ncbi:MAG: hypothetical protein B6U88_02920 [Candidatus Aenigmarchaeota archaeon ex4484_56]|nr:MAG: hypothetical protein B6U88_02920 [Candidatus Aenigmarchaeota archaeon ex4484_56]
MYKEILALLAICAIIAVSGCTFQLPGQQQTTPVAAGTQGLIIESFGPNVEYPVPDQSVDIEARIKNVGDAVAENIDGELYLLSWTSSKTNNCGSLSQPDPEIGREGAECTISWRVETPEVVDKTEDYEVGAHIFYDYMTTTVATVYAFSQDEYIKRMERGETIPTVRDIRNSNGPIHVDVRVQKVLRIPDTGTSNVPITLVFKNVGGGNPEYNAADHHYVLESATVDVLGSKVSCDSPIVMRGGNEGTCTVNIDLSSQSTGELKIPITVTTKYRYEISKETKITVHKLPE